MTDRRLERIVHLALLVLTAVTALMTMAGVTWPIRPIVTLVVAALLPGAAVLTRMPPVDVPTWFALACAISLAIEAAGSLVMVWLGMWSPALLSFALGTMASAVLVLYHRRTGQPTGEVAGPGGPGTAGSGVAKS